MPAGIYERKEHHKFHKPVPTTKQHNGNSILPKHEAEAKGAKRKHLLCRCGKLAHRMITASNRTVAWCNYCGVPDGVVVRADYMGKGEVAA